MQSAVEKALAAAVPITLPVKEVTLKTKERKRVRYSNLFFYI
jgi:hypothetical protein